ncbi:antA/AntB antirepressor family protein [Anaerotruncus sp. AF02-27]|uniref:antA/AntB antirepressor family protein n=1 Tax=Anaerotruncus sp. AF02-27 TaxID=2292191 RepID=UPI001313F562|nr:antA/AntB antirepressor family protein [Anaerotruncus sp. AF02-27]
MTDKLTVFNSDIIPVYTTEDGRRVVIGRELHERLKIGKDYSTWFKDMCGYGFYEDVDYSPFSGDRSDGLPGKPRTEHLLTLEMAKELAMIQRSPEGHTIRQKLIALETNVSELSPELRYLIKIEIEQKQQAKALEDMNRKLDDTCELIALDPTSWRKETQALISRISDKLGGFEHIRDVHEEIYKLVDLRGGVNLKRRLENKKARLAMEGAPKTTIKNLNRLDVIGDDKKLIEIYVHIVKQMAAKYQVAINEKGAVSGTS